MLAVAAFLENIVPPIPSDAIIALGAFLATRGTTAAPLVFLVAWAANGVGIVGVYWLAHRVGRRFTVTPLGSRLLTEGRLRVVERQVRRFGAAGLVLARLLPGFRGVAAPFAGLAGLAPVPALAPQLVGSALWYALVTGAGVLVGDEWDAVQGALGALNRGLLVASGVAVAVLAAWWWRHRGRA